MLLEIVYYEANPIVGAILAAAISAVFSSVAQARANRYNEPASQLKRLRKAGLPLAYMYKGGVNQQSGVPSLSIDPDLGFSEKQKLDIDRQVADAQLEGMKYDNEFKKAFAQWGQLFPDQTTGDVTNWFSQFEAKKKAEQAAAIIKENEARLKELEKQWAEIMDNEDIPVGLKRQELERIAAQTKQILAAAGLMEQSKDTREFDQWLNNQLEDAMKSMTPFQQTFMAIIYKAIVKQSGGVSIPGIN